MKKMIKIHMKLPEIIKVISFDDFIKYGIETGAKLTDKMPWSFDYEGHPVTHETDENYLVMTREGTINFTKSLYLVIDGDTLYVQSEESIKKYYVEVR